MKNLRLLPLLEAVALLAASGTLAGCNACEDVDCAPCNIYIQDIVLVLDRDSLQSGFRRAEINGGYAVRYAAPGFTTPLDTVRQSPNGADFYRSVISLRELPWPRVLAAGTPYDPAAYNFRLALPAANRTYDISDIELKTGPGDPESCCSCGENLRRRFVLNGTAIVADGNKNNERATVLRR